MSSKKIIILDGSSAICFLIAKWIIKGLTLSLAIEFAPKTRINCIAPSLLMTQKCLRT